MTRRHPGPRLAAAPAGFTLVELLVVIGIIAVLISILLPALGAARESAKSTKCHSNLRSIGMAILMYRNENRDYFHKSPNYGLWEKPAGTPLGPNDAYAYWGVAYLPYLSPQAAEQTEGPAERGRSVWRCEGSIMMDPDTGYSNQNQPANYGFNKQITGQKAGRYRTPTEMIVCHDSAEHLMEGDGDTLSAWGGSKNLSQWRNAGASYAFGNAVKEYYRHLHACNVLWMDGHVAGIPQSDGRDVPKTWYTGGF